MTFEKFTTAKNLLERIQNLEEKIKLFKTLPPNIALLNKDKTLFYDASVEMDEESKLACKQFIIESYQYQLKMLKQEFESL